MQCAHRYSKLTYKALFSNTSYTHIMVQFLGFFYIYKYCSAYTLVLLVVYYRLFMWRMLHWTIIW